VKDQYQAVVIGGGVVGCSVLYHLALRGMSDSALIERDALTAGSSWHAAGGFHAMNNDPRLAALQRYTIELYSKLEQESGRSIGMHMCGSTKLAGTPQRWQWLKSQLAWLRAQGTDALLLTPDEAAAKVPIMDPSGLQGALFDPSEGYLDPSGTTHAFAQAARAQGADVIEHNRVLSLSMLPNRMWRVETEQGVVTAQHVVNAAGLWARRVGNMVGVDHPLVPMLHHYLVTDDVAEIASFEGEMSKVIDLEGFTYMHREGNGVLLGVYERDPRHWQIQGAEWDYDGSLFREELERIMPELSVGLTRFPALAEIGIKTWVNGAVTFTPDGNPLVGPVAGLPNYWAACGCMAGFSQGGGIGLVLSNWIIDGDPGHDVFGMDVARFGPYASNDRYLRETTTQFYARRFVITYPNEELPAARPLKTTPCYDALAAAGARFTVRWGLEVPQYFAPRGFVETAMMGRSNVEPIIADEVESVRSAAGACEIGHYARYEVTGPHARAWLDHLLAGQIPHERQIRLTPMLGEAGGLMGDLTVACLDEGRFWLTGAYGLQRWHWRWFLAHLPADGVELQNITDAWMGFSVSGPKSRQILQSLTAGDLSSNSFGFLAVRQLDVGSARAVIGRISFTGELGYEIVVPIGQHRALLSDLRAVGDDEGLRLIGTRAINSLRIEKGYGVWSAEYRQDVTPAMSGLSKYIAMDKGGFIGRSAVMTEQRESPRQRLAILEVDASDADATKDDGIWLATRRVGLVTSGGYGHRVGKSLALGYVDTDVADSDEELTVFVIGEPRPARVLPEPPYDPQGLLMRGTA